MIEIVYNKEKENATGNEEFFCVPRNIRQIGDVPKETKIYMEDYVHTYLQMDCNEEVKGKIAILLGKYNWKKGVSYVFIKSAVLVEDIPVYRDNYPLTDAVWGTIYEEMKKYFPGQEVVGWNLSLPDCGLRMTDKILQTHLKHFGGNDKVLLLTDPEERESAFYLYKNNEMEKQKGYYIFYEENAPMQEYMLAKNPGAEVDYAGKVQDRAVKDFRKIAAKKLEERSEKQFELSWLQVACAGIVVVTLATGTIWMRNQNRVSDQTDAVNTEEVSSIVTETEQDNTEEDMVLLTPEITEQAEPPEGEVPEEMQPENTGEISPPEKDEEASISVYTKYTVRQGDTLSRISMRYYGDFSKVSEICKINNMIEDDVIYPGQTILLP